MNSMRPAASEALPYHVAAWAQGETARRQNENNPGLPRQLAFRVFENGQNLAIQRSFVCVALGYQVNLGCILKS